MVGLPTSLLMLVAALEVSPPPPGRHPRVTGPGRQEKVCVVGAGPAGIHMAYSLKRRGYSSVVVLERTGRVGGKCLDLHYRGVVWPLGAGVTVAHYSRNIIPLAEEFGFTGYTDVGSRGPANLLGGRTGWQNPLALIAALVNYVKIHRDMFGKYEGDLMPRPGPAVVYRTRGTFLDFMRREKLVALIEVFDLVHTKWGYGYLDEVSAVYALMWNTPEAVLPVVLGSNSVRLPDRGFQELWQTIVTKEQLDIQMNVDIHRVKRNNPNDFEIYQTQHSKSSVLECNFLVWTPEMSGLLAVLDSPSPREQNLLSGLTPEVYTANIINLRGETDKAISNTYLDNIAAKADHSVVLDLDVLALKSGRTPRSLGLRTFWSGQMGRNTSSLPDIQRSLRQHYLRQFPSSSLEVVLTKSWASYFPRWSPKDMMAGRPWDVFQLQGSQGVWYTGSSVSFESLSAVTEYNKLLLRQMVAREQH